MDSTSMIVDPVVAQIAGLPDVSALDLPTRDQAAATQDPEPLSTVAAVQPMAPVAMPPSPPRRHRLRHSRSGSFARARRVSSASRSSSESKVGKRTRVAAGAGMAHGPSATAESQISIALVASAALASVGTGLGTFATKKGSERNTVAENANARPHSKKGASSRRKKSTSPLSKQSRASSAQVSGPSRSYFSCQSSTSSARSGRSKSSIPRIAFTNIERKGEIYTPPPRGTFRTSYARFLRSEVPDFDPGLIGSAYRLGFPQGASITSGTDVQAVWARHALDIGPGDAFNPFLLPAPEVTKPNESKSKKSKNKSKSDSVSLPASSLATPSGIVSDPMAAYANYLAQRSASGTVLVEPTVLSICEFDLFSAARARAAAADERFAYHRTRFHKDSMRASGSGSSRSHTGSGSVPTGEVAPGAAAAPGSGAGSGAGSGVGIGAGRRSSANGKGSGIGTGSSAGVRSVQIGTQDPVGSGSAVGSGSGGSDFVPEWLRSPAAPPPPRMRRWLREAAARRDGTSGSPARIDEVPGS